MLAVPDALHQRGRKIGLLQRFLLQPTVYHIALVCGPLLCFGSLLVPILIGARMFNSTLVKHHNWLAHAADPTANVAELAAEARSIWLSCTRVAWFDSLIFGSESRKQSKGSYH